jgi:hypothetical protein
VLRLWGRHGIQKNEDTIYFLVCEPQMHSSSQQNAICDGMQALHILVQAICAQVSGVRWLSAEWLLGSGPAQDASEHFRVGAEEQGAPESVVGVRVAFILPPLGRNINRRFSWKWTVLCDFSGMLLGMLSPECTPRI